MHTNRVGREVIVHKTPTYLLVKRVHAVEMTPTDHTFLKWLR